MGLLCWAGLGWFCCSWSVRVELSREVHTYVDEEMFRTQMMAGCRLIGWSGAVTRALEVWAVIGDGLRRLDGRSACVRR